MADKMRWRMRESTAGASAPALMRASADDEGAQPCPDCNGGVREDGAQCTTCGGSGHMREADAGKVQCPTCDGSGKIRGGSLKCPDCNGTGQVSKDAPAVKESMVLRDFADLAECAKQPLAWYDGSLREVAVLSLSEKDYSTPKRVEFAKAGKAIPVKNDKGEVTGGAYPINDKGDLKDAIDSYGRNPTPETKAHIVKNAEKLGATGMLPDDWKGNTKETESILERLAALEQDGRLFRSLRESKPHVLNASYSDLARVKTADGKDEGYRVVLIREGRGNTEDDNYYTRDAIREMCESGAAEGMQAYANHPSVSEESDRPERDVRHLVGHYRDVAFSESGNVPRAEAVFVPLTQDETHPTYGWVVTLAEAASKNTGPKPLAGISLFGSSAGDFGERPDGSTGRIVSLIRPNSGDVVTNAGAGGGFIARAMAEGAARRTTSTHRKEQPMLADQFHQKFAEATRLLREASTDDQRTAALASLTELEGQKIDAPAAPVTTLAELQESAPQVAQALREAAAKEVVGDEDPKKVLAELKTLRESVAAINETTDIIGILKEAKVPDEDRAWFVAKAQERGLKEKADIVNMVEVERAYQKRQADAQVAAIKEAFGGDGAAGENIEGIFERQPVEPLEDGGVGALREVGVPLIKASPAPKPKEQEQTAAA